MSLQDVLEDFRGQVTAFASTGIVHGQDGTSIASLAAEGVDAEAGDAYLAEATKQHLEAQKQLGIEAATEDLILESTFGVAMARPLAGSSYIWTVLTGSEANIALTRALMRKYHDRVVEALP